VTVVLKGRNPAGLAAFARDVSTPGASVYHDYLTPSQFADRFGATSAQVQTVEANLRAHGLNPGPVSANRLSIPLNGTAAQVGRAFAVSFRRMLLPGGRDATVASAAPALDAPIAGDVQSVLGLSSLGGFHPHTTLGSILTPTTHPRLKAAASHVATGGPQPCSAASSSASSQGAYTADQIASAYRFSDLYQGGDQGQGQTIAIYELEPNDPNDIAAYQSCYGTHASVSYVPVDGGAGSGEGSGEAALDIENSIGLAPRANYLVYQGPNSNSSAPGSGPYDIFSAIINQDRAQVISVSWGECESSNTDGLQAENQLFQQAAAQGQSIVSASGDEGSEDCNAPPPSLPSTSLAVDDPASQPFVTGVGGTTLSTLGPPPGETVWNNGPIAALDGSGGAGGGGASQTWSMPSYQSAAAASLHVGQSSSREVPDVAADADPNTGYIVYWNGSGAAGVGSSSGWQAIGGTSASAPLWAALLADINASGACHGSPVGFANPALYRAAGTAYGSDFNDITSGNNDLLGLNGGQFAAGPFYDMASGLGTPRAGGLASALCGATARITNPGSQQATVGHTVGLQLKSTGPVVGRISWKASGLPPGLSVSGSSGRVSGRPRTAGVYSVVVSGTDQAAALSPARFSWTVLGLPTISRASLTGVATGRPTLSFRIASGARAAALKSITIALPAGLRFGARRGSVSVTNARGGRVNFSSRIVAGRLQITLASPQKNIGVRIKYAGISTTGGLAGRVRGHRVKSLQVTVTTTDAARHGSTLKARVRPA
jgi:subtilase family serine protease